MATKSRARRQSAMRCATRRTEPGPHQKNDSHTPGWVVPSSRTLSVFCSIHIFAASSAQFSFQLMWSQSWQGPWPPEYGTSETPRPPPLALLPNLPPLLPPILPLLPLGLGHLSFGVGPNPV